MLLFALLYYEYAAFAPVEPIDSPRSLQPHSELAVCHAEMSAVRTIVVGCGEPKKSMGWFHLQQLSVNPKAELLAVVEPW